MVREFPEIAFIPEDAIPFTTLGHWYEPEPGKFRVLVVKMADWRYTLIVLFHELVEWAVCQRDGVKTADCDTFDEFFEKEYEAGRRKVEEEAGCDKLCPYHKGHMWGIRMERFLCFLLRIRWKEYCRVCEAVIDRIYRAKHPEESNAA